jgi:cell division inhibitor SulA/protein ImuA
MPAGDEPAAMLSPVAPRAALSSESPLNALSSSLRSSSLDAVLAHPAIWRGGDCAPEPAAVPTGFAALDAVLPGGGWPQAALTEMLLAREGIGELRLVLPGLARLQADERDVIWIAPPHLPYAPALAAAGLDLHRLVIVRPAATADALWAFEQALRAPECGAAFLWPQGCSTTAPRAACRSPREAAAGACCGAGQTGIAGAALLRLALAPAAQQLAVHVVKRRGGEVARPVLLDLDLAPTPSGRSDKDPAGAAAGGRNPPAAAHADPRCAPGRGSLRGIP